MTMEMNAVYPLSTAGAAPNLKQLLAARIVPSSVKDHVRQDNNAIFFPRLHVVLAPRVLGCPTTEPFVFEHEDKCYRVTIYQPWNVAINLCASNEWLNSGDNITLLDIARTETNIRVC